VILFIRHAASCLAPTLVAACFAPIAAAADEGGAAPISRQDDLLDRSTVAIASQNICGFDVDQTRSEPSSAARTLDTPWALFDAQIREYQRNMLGFSEWEKARRCAKARPLAEAAG
jgi:hypothetical protein